MPDVLLHRLSKGLDELGVEISAKAKHALVDYVLQLDKWNKTYNLTAVRNTEQMISRHVLDSLTILPFLHGTRILDVGTGPGLPGLPLAIVESDMFFTLLDSNSKKTRFLTQVVADLGLENIEIIQERSEKFQPDEKFDTLTTRAFATVTEMLEKCGHLCAANGRLIAMKGILPEDELAALPKEFELIGTEKLNVPGLEAERHAVIIVPRQRADQ